MAKYEIKYGTCDSYKSKNRWISFEVQSHKYSKSIFVDLNIFKNIDNEIEYWKSKNIFFTNIDTIKWFCADHLRWNKKISFNEYNHYIKDNTTEYLNWNYISKPYRVEIDDTKQKNQNYISKTYLMKDTNTGFYKIGKSINPKFREQTLQSEKPTIKMVKIWEKDIEKELHSLYKSFRVRGEWFNLSNIQLKYICTKF